MKRTLLILAGLCAICAAAAAQSTWFAKEAGTKLGYEQKDAEGKTTNSFSYVVTSCEKDGAKTVINYDMIVPILDKPVSTFVWTEGGMFHSDAAASLGSMGSDIKVSGNAPIIPENPVIGAKLENCTLNVESLATTAEYSNIRFTKHEEVTTAAGTFDCWCLEFDTATKMAFIKAITKTEQWMAKDVGVVKTVVKDKKGGIQTVTELASIEK